MEKYVTKQIHDIVADMKEQLNKLEKALNKSTVEKYDRQRIITMFINIEYFMGKYHAYLSMLDDHEHLDMMVKLSEENAPIIKRCFDVMEKLYTF